MEKVLTFSQIDELAKKLANYVEENTVIALIGELGTGKTTFTKIFAKEFGVKENLKSPTFNYVLEYLSGRMPLYHFDVYRLDDISELENIGFYEYTEDCVSIVEWADKFPDELPDETLWIYLKPIGDTSRSIILGSDYLTAEDLVEIGGPYVVGN